MSRFTLCAGHLDQAMMKQKLRQPGRVRHDAWQAYRRLPEVLEAHAGANEFDPYKD